MSKNRRASITLVSERFDRVGDMYELSNYMALLNAVLWFTFIALTSLVCKSVTEDRYGVVQQDLGEILRTLLNLYEVSTMPGRFPVVVLERLIWLPYAESVSLPCLKHRNACNLRVM